MQNGRRWTLGFAVSLLLGSAAWGKNGDTVRLQAVDVRSVPRLFGEQVLALDTAVRGWNAQDWLHRGAVVRATTPGGSLLVGMSGLPAIYTGFHWLGFSMASPTLGLTDGSWVHPAFRQSLSVVSRLHGSYMGSGNLGGVVDLSHSWRGTEGSWASSELYSAGGGGATCRIQSKTGTLGLHASRPLYRFSYQNYLGQWLTRSGADAQNLHAEYRGDWTTPKGGQLRWGVMALSQDRGLPKSTSSSYGLGDRQRDRRLQAGFRWTWSRGGWTWSPGAFAWTDYQDFDARVVALRDSHQTAGMRMDWTGTHPKGHWSAGWSQVGAWGPAHRPLSVGDGHWKGAYLNRWGKIQTVAWARLDYRNVSGDSRWAGSGGIQGRTAKGWQCHVARHFRWPTLNDLAWIPGGNIDLLPEQGWAAEAVYKPVRQRPWSWQVHTKGTVLHQSLVWIPVGSLWQPINGGAWSQWWTRLRVERAGAFGIFWAEVESSRSSAAFSVPWKGGAGYSGGKRAWQWGVEAAAQTASLLTPRWSTMRLWGSWKGKRWNLHVQTANAVPWDVNFISYYPNPKFYTTIQLIYKFNK